MLGQSLQQTRVYQDAKSEGIELGIEQGIELGREEQKAKIAKMLRVTVPLLLRTGMSMDEIAQQLDVDLESVRLAVG